MSYNIFIQTNQVASFRSLCPSFLTTSHNALFDSPSTLRYLYKILWPIDAVPLGRAQPGNTSLLPSYIFEIVLWITSILNIPPAKLQNILAQWTSLDECDPLEYLIPLSLLTFFTA